MPSGFPTYEISGGFHFTLAN
uniref:Uncharacterized protein n=1 Tax=Arundo donax TaxID=35708 RepID=A0A0A9A4R9_ARUDO